eukprot:GDKI01002155.1.p1 GENE.GDKI01002155.1~~GDKI01002155.1.p1  ORF type:complete len:266 (-),score=66.46 GDKI01002155.1:188-949(-)
MGRRVLASLLLLAAALLNTFTAGEIVMQFNDLKSMTKAQMDLLFTEGTIDNGVLPMGVAQGYIPLQFIPKNDPRSQLYSSPAWRGSFFQKTICDRKPFYMFFALFDLQSIPAIGAPTSAGINLLTGGNKKLSEGQMTVATAYIQVGMVGDPEQRLDDQPSFVMSFGVTPDMCPDRVDGRITMAGFSNPPPIRYLRDEMRRIGVDPAGNLIYLNRVFAVSAEGFLEPIQYEALLFSAGALDPTNTPPAVAAAAE